MTKIGRPRKDDDVAYFNPLIQLEKSMDFGESHDYRFENGDIINLTAQSARNVFDWLMQMKPSHRLAITKKMMIDADSFTAVLKTYGIQR